MLVSCQSAIARHLAILQPLARVRHPRRRPSVCDSTCRPRQGKRATITTTVGPAPEDPARMHTCALRAACRATRAAHAMLRAPVRAAASLPTPVLPRHVESIGYSAVFCGIQLFALDNVSSRSVFSFGRNRAAAGFMPTIQV